MKKVFIWMIAGLVFFTGISLADEVRTDTIYIDAAIGKDSNPGTEFQPFNSFVRASEWLKAYQGEGAVRFVVSPGIYSISSKIVLESKAKFNKDKRLSIVAAVLPDMGEWRPFLMPVLISTETPVTSGTMGSASESYTLDIKENHVSIRGLRFLGNPMANNYHAAIEHVENGASDLRISQCVFEGSDTIDMYCPVIMVGNGLVIDRCIFYKTKNGVVFWDGMDGKQAGKDHRISLSLFIECGLSAVWTCQTDANLTFSNNIVSGCNYFWMRKPGDSIVYTLNDTLLVDWTYLLGEGGPMGPFSEVKDAAFNMKNITMNGPVELDMNRKSRTYLHPKKDTPGFSLGAGLFLTE